MGSEYGAVFPTESLSRPVHPDRPVMGRNKPFFASSPGSVGGRRSQADTSRRKGKTFHKHKKLTAKETGVDGGLEEDITKMAKVVSKIKGGHNPTGRQHKLTKTTPGSPGTNASSPLTKQASTGWVKAAVHLIRNKHG